jgi:predicted RNase H-like nuclease (RuvC/YqgF family)
MPFPDKPTHEPDLLNPTPEEDLTLELQQQQQRLLDLKRQQEEVERRRRELEEIHRRREEFADGRKALHEKFNRAILLLEREERDARKEVEQLQMIRQQFEEHLGIIDSINPQSWQPESLQEELARALNRVEDANMVYNKSRAKVDALSSVGLPDDGSAESQESGYSDRGGDASFAELVRRGFALSLPIAVLLAILILVLLVK